MNHPSDDVRLIVCPHPFSTTCDRVESKDDIRFFACSRPFSSQRVETLVPPGTTVAEALRTIGIDRERIYARVFIDDQLIPEAEWEFAVPAPGQLITARAIPTGSGAGGGKDVLRTVAMLGIIALSIVGGPVLGGPLAGFFGVSTLTGNALAMAAISMVGSLMIQAQIPPSLPKRYLP